MSRSPFKRLHSYGREDGERYFGRERETGRLFNALRESNLVVVHGGPRTGKTSLIRCGLGSLLLESEWLPLLVERGPDLNQWLDRSIAHATKGGIWPPDKPLASPAERIRALYLESYRTVYLIFEDFEQLLVRGSSAERQRFYETAGEILESGTGCKILIVMREEYLASLSEFEKVVPHLFDQRLRVETPPDAVLARIVLATARAAGVEVVDPAATVYAILENVRGPSSHIDLGGLQLYLDWMWRADLVRQGTATPARVTFDPGLAERVGRLEPGWADLLDKRGDELAALLEVRLAAEEEFWEDGVAPPEAIPLEMLFSTLLDPPGVDIESAVAEIMARVAAKKLRKEPQRIHDVLQQLPEDREQQR